MSANRATSEIEKIEQFKTPDGEIHPSMVCAEYHLSRRKIVALLTEKIVGFTGTSVGAEHLAEEICNTLSANTLEIELTNRWLHNCLRMQDEMRKA